MFLLPNSEPQRRKVRATPMQCDAHSRASAGFRHSCAARLGAAHGKSGPIEPRLSPELQGQRHWVDLDCMRPSCVALPVKLAMVDATLCSQLGLLAVAAHDLEIGLHHFADQFIERDLVPPTEPLARFRRIAEELVNLRWAEI